MFLIFFLLLTEKSIRINIVKLRYSRYGRPVFNTHHRKESYCRKSVHRQSTRKCFTFHDPIITNHISAYVNENVTFENLFSIFSLLFFLDSITSLEIQPTNRFNKLFSRRRSTVSTKSDLQNTASQSKLSQNKNEVKSLFVSAPSAISDSMFTSKRNNRNSKRSHNECETKIVDPSDSSTPRKSKSIINKDQKSIVLTKKIDQNQIMDYDEIFPTTEKQNESAAENLISGGKIGISTPASQFPTSKTQQEYRMKMENIHTLFNRSEFKFIDISENNSNNSDPYSKSPSQHTVKSTSRKFNAYRSVKGSQKKPTKSLCPSVGASKNDEQIYEQTITSVCNEITNWQTQTITAAPRSLKTTKHDSIQSHNSINYVNSITIRSSDHSDKSLKKPTEDHLCSDSNPTSNINLNIKVNTAIDPDAVYPGIAVEISKSFLLETTTRVKDWFTERLASRKRILTYLSQFEEHHQKLLQMDIENEKRLSLNIFYESFLNIFYETFIFKYFYETFLNIFYETFFFFLHIFQNTCIFKY